MRKRVDRRPLFPMAALALVLLADCAGCSGGGEPPDGAAAPGSAHTGVIRVETVNYPLRYFAERIGGERARVMFRAPAGVDPSEWSPEAGDIAAIQAADLVLLNGAGYARWLDRTSLALSRLVDTSRGFRDRYLTEQSAVTHSHGPGGKHSHAGVAFTTWLDPLQAIEQAAAIRDAFKAARPAFQAEFDSRFAALAADLEALDRSLHSAFSGLGTTTLVASHPVYQYLARRYGLDLKSVHFEPGEPPDERGWRELRELLRAHPARWMLWEGEPLAATAGRLEEIGVAIILFDPCAGTPASGDLLSILQANAERVRTASQRSSVRTERGSTTAREDSSGEQ